MDKGKGKQIAGKKLPSSSSAGKKRRGGIEFRDEGLRPNKRKNPEVLQFFEESAEVGYYGESSDEDCNVDDFLNDDMDEDEPEVEVSVKDDKVKRGKATYVFPKEEEINEDDFDRIMEERYRPGSGFLRYADDDVKDSIEMDALAPTKKDPPIWKVKCALGREKHLVFCLMHKFVEMRKIRNKLHILSVFYVEHVKGFIFIEAEKEHDLLEACNGITGIYATRMMLVSKADAPQLLTVQRKSKNISQGKWARIKSGIYKGDLAQIVAVNDGRRKALIKLIPRIDMQALNQKYGGGVSVQKGPPPAPRLISSSELEEFRPLIQVRRDRDTGLTFEHLDSLMLRDGYLYKKVSLDSLSSCGVIPSKEEILKFTPVELKETDDVEWISEIYGEEKEKKKKILPAAKWPGKGEGSSSGKGEGLSGGKGEGPSGGKGEGPSGGKGEGSSGGKGEGSVGGKGEGSSGGTGEGSPESKPESSYELYNLVCFSRKEFGLIVGVDDKGDGYKVLKEGSDGPVVVSVGKKEMQNGPFDSRFTALDLNNKQISINDVVKISKGPSEGKQGVVRQIYRGVVFFYDENADENGGYFCCNSRSCEKIKLFTEEPSENTGGFDASAFGDYASSPKSPLAPEKEWQPKGKYVNSNQGDKGSMYSIGQKLRIRVGPLKGYLCRVIAIRFSEVTVKLDSQHKILTVKSEHVAEVRDRNTVLSTSGDVGTGSFQPFDMLGTEGSSGGDGGNWNIGGVSTDSNPWGIKPTSDVSQPTVPDDNNSAWGVSAKPTPAGDQPDGWSSWGKTPVADADSVGGWGDAGASKVEASTWGKQGASTSNAEDLGAWGKPAGSSDANKEDEDSGWGKIVEDFESSKKKEESSGWNKSAEDSSASKGVPAWGKPDGGSSWGNKDDGGSSWGKKDDGNKVDGGSSWGKKDDGGSMWEKKDDGGSTWGKKDDGGSSWGKKDDSNKDDGGSWGKKVDGGSSWGKKDDGGSTWGKKDDGGSAWGKTNDSNKDDGGSSWGKKVDGGSTWGKKDDGVSTWGKKDDGGSAWDKTADSNKDDGGSSWGKKVDGGSTWGKKDDGGSTWDKKDDGGSAWDKTDDSNKDDGGSSWGKKVDGGSSWGKKDDGGSTWGKKDDGGSAWGKTNDSSKDDGGSSWGAKVDGGSSWGKNDGGSWGKKNDGGYSEQTFDRGGRGFGGRRGGGRRGGRDQFGRGRSFNNSEDSTPWSKQGGGSTWGKQDSGGGGSSWGKQNDAGGGSSWGKQDDAGGGSSWGKQNDAAGGSSWGKQDGSGGGSGWGKQDSGGSAWGKQNDSGGESSWGKQKDTSGGSSWGKQNDTGGGSSWGKQNDGGGGGSSWKQDGGGGGSSWGKQDSGGGGSAWGKQSDGGGGSSWGKQDGGGGGSSWGKQDGGGGSSWSTQGGGGSKPWNEQGGGGRGFGGRRGGGFRGGFRGGRNQSGRDGGRSFDRDQSSGWKRDNQENTWKSDQSGGSDWKKGWGEDSNNKKPSDSSTGGGDGGNWSSWGTKKPVDASTGGGNGGGNWSSWDTKKPVDASTGSGSGGGNWSSWDTNSKKEANAGDDKPGNENKTAWGTGNDQANTGNNNDGWGKKPDDDVKTTGEADNAWGGKTNASSSGSAW